MDVKFTVLQRTFELHKDEYEAATLRALRSGMYVLGDELSSFETEFASFFNRKHAIGVNSGQDALILAVRALGIGPGDEVIIQSNAYIASVYGITENGATPVFVEPDQYFGLDPEKIENAITPRTKAILPVHLYGQICDMEKVRAIADKHNLYVIEDCAQAHGASINGRLAGTFSDIACFSFYPTKPLGAFGDGGMLLTNSDSFNETLRMLRFYGSKEKYVSEICGVNSRLDEIQAANLKVGLKYLHEGIKYRNMIADRYSEGIDNDLIKKPETRTGCNHVYHIYPILCERRDNLIKFLADNGINTQIHYPIPPHLQKCFKDFGYKRGDFPVAEKYADQEVSLPVYAGMPEDELKYVIDTINRFK